MNADPARAYMSIGEVLAVLRADFPDVSVSKIRFLEAEGLISPARTPSGYRRFTHADIERLRYILTAQRDHYLPLRVIRERLAERDRGERSARPARPLARADGSPRPATHPSRETRFTREELLAATRLTDDVLTQLERSGLVRASGRFYDDTAYAVGCVAVALARFGVEVRHLRAVKAAADREVGLIEQVVAPLLRRRDPEARGRAGETAREIATLSLRLHAALVQARLREGLEGR